MSDKKVHPNDEAINAVAEATGQAKVDALQGLLEAAMRESEAFYVKGNSSAGTRLRKVMKGFADAGKDVRKDVSAVKSAK